MRSLYWGLLIIIIILIIISTSRETFLPVTEQAGCPPHYKRDLRMANVACIPCPVINGYPLC